MVVILGNLSRTNISIEEVVSVRQKLESLSQTFNLASEGVIAVSTEEAEAKLKQLEDAAWQEYLGATRGQPQTVYDTVEAWAGSRLDERLAKIEARRRRLHLVAA